MTVSKMKNVFYFLCGFVFLILGPIHVPDIWLQIALLGYAGVVKTTALRMYIQSFVLEWTIAQEPVYNPVSESLFFALAWVYGIEIPPRREHQD